MLAQNRVQDTHISTDLKSLHLSMLGIVSVMNRPANDLRLIKEAGITLDPALFRLLVVIERVGPIGVVELADRLGRDYTTISRQVAKLVAKELVTRQGNPADRRMREAVIAPKGKAMTDRLDAARARMAAGIFATWEPQDVKDLVRLMAKFSAALEATEQ